MTIHIIALIGAENAIHVVCKALGCIYHLGFSGQMLVFGCHLEEVTRIIHLVLETEVFPALVESGHDEPCDEKSVLLLGGENAINDPIYPLAQRGIRVVL